MTVVSMAKDAAARVGSRNVDGAGAVPITN